MGALHEVLAARTKREEQAKTALAHAKKIFAHDPHFEAFLQNYRHLEDDPAGLHREPPKQMHMTTTVGAVLGLLRDEVSPQIDVNYVIDITNMEATGTIEVEGLNLPELPTTQMLALKKTVEQLLGALRVIPTHDPKYQWVEDTDRGNGTYKTDPVVTYRTSKRVVQDVVVQPTKEHRAEIRERSEDVVSGEITKNYWSGKLTQKQKTSLLKKAEELLVGIQVAIAKANRIEQKHGKIGNDLFSWLFSDLSVE